MKKPMRILVVDDNRDLAENIRDILSDNGYEVSAAYDGQGAIAHCRERPFDVVLVDYKLPDMDGLELQARLSELMDADYIFITAHGSMESAAEAVKRKQIVGYETKPLNMDRLMSFIQQVTDRRRAETALRRSEATARTLLNVPTAAAFLLDTDGICLDANDTLARWLGKTAADIIGKPIWDLLPPDITAHRRTHFAEVLKTRAMVRYEDEREGTWNDTIISPVLDDRGEISTVAVMSVDITARKRADQERLEMERRILELQRLDSLGVMAGGIAHDFNNMLMIIIGNLDMAIAEIDPSSGILRCLEEVRKASVRATERVHQILAYSGKSHFVPAPVEINPVVDEVIGILGAGMPAAIRLNAHPDGENPTVAGDRTQLTQVVISLITNAWEAIDPETGGTVTVSTGFETCDAESLKETVVDVWMGYEDALKSGRYAFLEVTDNGRGMDDQVRRRLFEPFFSTKFQGRGLGLAAVMGIVKAHGGFIRVTSRPEHGTVVRVLFPAQAEGAVSAAEGPPETPESPPRGSGRVLVVDDEAAVREVVRKMLERAGYEVRVAGGGVEAIECYQNHVGEIDLILMDLSMPGMSGVDAFDALRQMGCEVPVVLSSGYSREGIRPQYEGRGFAGFIEKPFTRKDLMRLLADIGQVAEGGS
jgi:two-component system, cell cycle sensor histidine kinase and response regulator CckA